MSHMKFKETGKKLYVRVIYGYLDFTLKIYIPLDIFWYIFKVLFPAI